MAIEIIAIDHIYITVSQLERSEVFYDGVMRLLGMRKGDGLVGGQRHVNYFKPIIQYTLRPAKPGASGHDAYVPGLHHLCFQVMQKSEVDEAAGGLEELGVKVSQPRLYPEYGADYYAIYFKDPDGIGLEIVNRTHIRRLIGDHWTELKEFENPLSKAGLL